MRPEDLALSPIVPVMGSSKDALKNNGAFNGMWQGLPCADTPARTVDNLKMIATGRCKMFDLSKEEDRNTYADLITSGTSGEISVLWEEKIKVDDRLIVYINYLEIAYAAVEVLT